MDSFARSAAITTNPSLFALPLFPPLLPATLLRPSRDIQIGRFNLGFRTLRSRRARCRLFLRLSHPARRLSEFNTPARTIPPSYLPLPMSVSLPRLSSVGPFINDIRSEEEGFKALDDCISA